MKNYNYKMQWILPLNASFNTSQKQARKNVTNFIKCVGARSFTKIVFRDKDLKCIDTYSNMVMYTETVAVEKIGALIKSIKPDGDIQYIEFIRK